MAFGSTGFGGGFGTNNNNQQSASPFGGFGSTNTANTTSGMMKECDRFRHYAGAIASPFMSQSHRKLTTPMHRVWQYRDNWVRGGQ